AMPKNLELEPLSYRDRNGGVSHIPEFLRRQVPVGYVVTCDYPEEIAVVYIRVPFYLSRDAVIAVSLPLEEETPIPGSCLAPKVHTHELCQTRLELQPVADIKVACCPVGFARGLDLETVLRRPFALGIPSAAPALSDLGVERLGRGAIVPSDGQYLIEHVIADGRGVHRCISQKLNRRGAAAPYAGWPGVTGA